MFTRIIQLGARAFAVALTAVAAKFLGGQLEPDQVVKAGELAGGVAAALGAVVLFLVDLLIHRAGAGKIMTPPGETDLPATPRSVRAPSSLALLLGAGALLGLALIQGGCAAPGSLPAADFDQTATRLLDYAEPRIATEPGLSDFDRKDLLMKAALLRRGFDAAMRREPSPTAFESLYPALGPASPDG
ncbi:MAG: hypothetical protein KF684_04120 [Phycisphaeraceae bacterium]|nr:hypothetical protein [Phycisphaeraceae bacterium]